MSNLTRAERIKKLGNSIRRYRGEYRPSEQVAGKAIKWLTPPDPSAKEDVVNWFERLGYDSRLEMGRVDGLKNHTEMAEFMKGLK